MHTKRNVFNSFPFSVSKDEISARLLYLSFSSTYETILSIAFLSKKSSLPNHISAIDTKRTLEKLCLQPKFSFSVRMTIRVSRITFNKI